ncbi:MAG: hypothetical protein PVF12_06835, partial [Thiohalocapsa sp.]
MTTATNRPVHQLAALRLGAAACGLLVAGLAWAADNMIAPGVESVEVKHDGETIVVKRGHDLDAKLPEMFQKTER